MFRVRSEHQPAFGNTAIDGFQRKTAVGTGFHLQFVQYRGGKEKLILCHTVLIENLRRYAGFLPHFIPDGDHGPALKQGDAIGDIAGMVLLHAFARTAVPPEIDHCRVICPETIRQRRRQKVIVFHANGQREAARIPCDRIIGPGIGFPIRIAADQRIAPEGIRDLRVRFRKLLQISGCHHLNTNTPDLLSAIRFDADSHSIAFPRRRFAFDKGKGETRLRLGSDLQTLFLL